MTMLDQAQQDRSNLLKDPKLPHLATVMDGTAMAGHFTQYLHALGVEPAWEVTRCTVEGVYYRRAKHCSVLYRLTLRHPSGAEADEWFHGRMFPPGHGIKQFAEEAPTATPSHPAYDFFHGIQAVSLWRDFDMILRMFPHDPGVVTL